MSNELLNLAWTAEIPSGPKFVLVALADRARKDGCWPSREAIMKMTGFGKSAVSSHLSWLQEHGYVKQQRRRQKSAVYTLDRSRMGTQEVQIPDISESPDREVQDPDILNQEVQNSDVLNNNPAAQITLTVVGSAKQDVQNLDVQNPDLSDREVQNLDIPKENPKLKRSRRQTPDNPDARKLCERLAELMVENGCRPPTITQDWLDEARRLLDRDHTPFVEALSVLEWCQADTFWRTNVLSMPKFRKQYDALRLRTEQAGSLNEIRTVVPRTKEDAVELIREMWRKATTKPITELTGLEWDPPDVPLDTKTKEQIDAFYDEDKQQWITKNFETILAAILTKGQAA